MDNNHTIYKFVAVLNKKVDIGKIMNSLAHMSLGMVASAAKDELDKMGFIDYIDKDGKIHKTISKNGYVILQADNSNQIRTLRNLAIEKNLRYVDFTNTMTEGTYVDQLEKTSNTSEQDLEYYGICLFGDKIQIDEMTRKFSLWH